MSEFDYKKDVSIDEDALDIEWLQQPELMMKYSRIEAKAEKQYQQAKEQLSIVEAELYQKICNNPDAYDLPKTTEGAIQGAIIKTEEYKEAKENKEQARYEMNMAKAAVKALYGKKDALENLVRLHGQQYFAGPKAPRNLSRELQKKGKQTKSNKEIKISTKKPKSKKRRRRK